MEDKKRRLRASEVVGAVGVEDGAVVFDLEEEVLDHVLGEVCAVVFDEAEDDEVAVPAVHFVEAASRHDIGIGKIEQALCRDFGDTNVSDVGDLAGQLLYFNVALLVCGCNSGRRCHARGEIEYRRCRDLGIDQ